MAKEVQAADILNVIFMIDTSGSMEGDKINAVNAAMPEIKQELMSFENKESHKVELHFAVLTFDTNVKWHIAPPRPLSDFVWNNLSARGQTRFGEACKQVEEKLHTSSDFYQDKNMRQYKYPLLILLSDGEPYGDVEPWEGNLEKLQKNKQYQNGTHISIALPGITSEGREVLKAFSAEGALIDVKDPSQLIPLIKIATLSATQSLSSSGTLSNVKNANKSAVNNVINSVSKIPGVKAEAVPLSTLQQIRQNSASNYS